MSTNERGVYSLFTSSKQLKIPLNDWKFNNKKVSVFDFLDRNENFSIDFSIVVTSNWIWCILLIINVLSENYFRLKRSSHSEDISFLFAYTFDNFTREKKSIQKSSHIYGCVLLAFLLVWLLSNIKSKQNNESRILFNLLLSEIGFILIK